MSLDRALRELYSDAFRLMKAAHDRRGVVADHGCGQVRWLCRARSVGNRAIKIIKIRSLSIAFLDLDHLDRSKRIVANVRSLRGLNDRVLLRHVETFEETRFKSLQRLAESFLGWEGNTHIGRCCGEAADSQERQPLDNVRK